MRIAYILLCHKNPEQINRLVSQLVSGNDSDVFIHLDKKSFNIKKEILLNSRIRILSEKESFAISWGSNDIVRATLALIRAVKKTNKKYDYICLLSGQDYPLTNQKALELFLAKNPDYNYINIIDDQSKEYIRRKKLCDIWYPRWIVKNNCLVKCVKRVYMLLTGGFCYTPPLFKRKKPFSYRINFGSQWWCLKSNVAFGILDYCDKCPDVVRFFDHVIIPDECFFQTMFKGLFGSEKYNRELTFVNWKDDRRSPSTLTIGDEVLLMKKSKEFFFARKFDLKVDDAILAKIDEELIC